MTKYHSVVPGEIPAFFDPGNIFNLLDIRILLYNLRQDDKLKLTVMQTTGQGEAKT